MKEAVESDVVTADPSAKPTPKARCRRPRPAVGDRDWRTAEETAVALGCSVATVHRLRRGLIPGVAPLPCLSVGTRKFVFLQSTIQRWRSENEKGTRG